MRLSFYLKMLLLSSPIMHIFLFPTFPIFLYYYNRTAQFLKLIIKLFGFILQPLFTNSKSVTNFRLLLENSSDNGENY